MPQKKSVLEVVLGVFGEKLDELERTTRSADDGQLVGELRELCSTLGALANEQATTASGRHTRPNLRQVGMDERLAELSDEVSRAHVEAETLRTLLEEHEEHEADAVARAETLQRELDAAGEAHTETRAELEASALRIEALEAELSSALAQRGETEEGLGQRVAELEAELEEYRKKQRDHEGVLERLRADNAHLTRQAEDLRLAASEAKVEHAETSRLQAELTEAKQRADAAKAECQDAKQDADKARLELAQIQESSAAQLEDASARIEELEERLRTARDRSTEHLVMEESLSWAETERARLTEQVETLQRRFGQQRARVEEFRRSLTQVQVIADECLRLDAENQRLSRLVGEARKRGRVNVREILSRADLIRRLEELAEAFPKD